MGNTIEIKVSGTNYDKRLKNIFFYEEVQDANFKDIAHLKLIPQIKKGPYRIKTFLKFMCENRCSAEKLTLISANKCVHYKNCAIQGRSDKAKSWSALTIYLTEEIGCMRKGLRALGFKDQGSKKSCSSFGTIIYQAPTNALILYFPRQFGKNQYVNESDIFFIAWEEACRVSYTLPSIDPRITHQML